MDFLNDFLVNCGSSVRINRIISIQNYQSNKRQKRFITKSVEQTSLRRKKASPRQAGVKIAALRKCRADSTLIWATAHAQLKIALTAGFVG